MDTIRVDNWIGGLRADLRDQAKRPPATYLLAVNLRSRSNTLAPVKSPLSHKKPGWNRLQGSMGMGKWLVAIADGEAWVKDTSVTNASWRRLVGYSLSPTATEVWQEVVPVSINTFIRTRSGASRDSAVLLESQIPQLANGFYSDQGGGLPCMIVQDGTSTPMVIHPDASGATFTCRRARTYAEWTPENPEFIPVGYQMQRVGNTLYIVGKSRYAFENRRVIYRSVSGRMTDFMINIRQDGSKEPLEDEGGPRTTAIASDFDEITCISRISSSSNNFMVCTRSRAWLMQPDYSTLIFGEPTFGPNDLYIGPVGAVSQYAVAEMTNDIAVISANGIRSFNAVAQQKSRAEHSVLSAPVNELFKDVKQFSGAAITNDNYTLFGLTTRYGPAILVYDNTPNESSPVGRFVALDIFPEFNDIGTFTTPATATAAIKQFAVTEDTTFRKVFMRTENDLLELYANNDYRPGVYLGEFATPDNNKALVTNALLLGFVHNDTSSDVTVHTIADGTLIESHNRNLLASEPAVVTLPFGTATSPTPAYAEVSLANNPVCHRAGFYVSWRSAAELSTVDFTYTDTDTKPYQIGFHV